MKFLNTARYRSLGFTYVFLFKVVSSQNQTCSNDNDMLYKFLRIKTNYKDDSIKNHFRCKKATRGITTESVYSEYPIA